MVPGVRTPVVRRPVRKAIRSPQSTAEVKYKYSYSCIIQYVLMAWCVINYSDHVTFIGHFLIFFVAHRLILQGIVITCVCCICRLLPTGTARTTCSRDNLFDLGLEFNEWASE